MQLATTGNCFRHGGFCTAEETTDDVEADCHTYNDFATDSGDDLIAHLHGNRMDIHPTPCSSSLLKWASTPKMCADLVDNKLAQKIFQLESESNSDDSSGGLLQPVVAEITNAVHLLSSKYDVSTTSCKYRLVLSFVNEMWNKEKLVT